MNLFHHMHTLPPYFTHVHENLEVTYCVQGSYLFHFEALGADGEKRNMEEHVTSGMLILMPKGIAHGNSSVVYPYDRYFFEISDEELNAIQGSSSLLSMLMRRNEDTLPLFWDLSSHGDIFAGMLEQMYTVHMDDHIDPEWRQMHLHHLVGLFFCEIHKHYPNYFTTTASAYTKPVQQVKAYIDAHYQQPITIEEMAKACYLTANYLSRRFCEQMGMSPRQYLTQRRLTMARMDLCSTTLPVQQIAMRNGFCDVNYFIQVFKRFYGMTPKQYQKQILESQNFA